jgi:hypothetical protein
VEISQIECQCCAKLKVELNSVTLELESAKEIIRILKEELGVSNMEIGNNTAIARNTDDTDIGTDSSRDERSWNLVQRNRHKETKAKKKDYIEVSLRANNRFEVLTNLNETWKPAETVNGTRPILSTHSNNNGGKETPSTRKHDLAVNYIPVIVNGKKATYNSDYLVPSAESIRINKTNSYNTMNNKSNYVNKQKVRILGDSHTRGSAIRIGEYLGDKFEVYGVTKPGARVADIIAQTNLEHRNLTKNDVIVLQGGSNDVYRNDSKAALTQIVKFCKDVSNTNIILLDVPHRHDLEKNSCVNKEIQTFNRKLRKITKLFKHVTILEVSFKRVTYTQHGLHLNRLGKRLIAKQIAREIYRVTKEKIDSPISLDWKLGIKRMLADSVSENFTSPGPGNLDEQQPTQPDNIQQLNTVQEDTHVRRPSSRPKKLPVTRKSDFLWGK